MSDALSRDGGSRAPAVAIALSRLASPATPHPRRRGSIALAEIAQDVRLDITGEHRDPDFVI